jgi:hypothetical protein
MSKKSNPKSGKGGFGKQNGGKQSVAKNGPMSRRPPRQPGR